MAEPHDANCVFCKIVAGTIPCFKLHETDDALAFMDINPANEGHCLVIAKAHHPTVLDLPPDLFARLAPVIHKVAGAVWRTVQPDGLNLVQANGKGAAQSVPHFHVHVLPRRLGDQLDFNWIPKPGDMGRIGELAARIRENIA